MPFDDGTYILGTAPRDGQDGKPLHRITIKDGKIINFDEDILGGSHFALIWKTTCQFILNGGRCRVKDDKDADSALYWLVKEKSDEEKKEDQ